MINHFINEPILDLYIFETRSLLEQLEQLMLNGEKTSEFESSINEIFRIMHTIKSSSAMMLFDSVAGLSHSVEDLFYFLREQKPRLDDYSQLIDLVLPTIDFIKQEVDKIETKQTADGNATPIIDAINQYLKLLQTAFPTLAINKLNEPGKAGLSKSNDFLSSNKLIPSTKKYKFKVTIFFDDGCQMENVKAFAIANNLKEFTENLTASPQDIIENNETERIIREKGFQMTFETDLGAKNIKTIIRRVSGIKAIKISPQKKDNIGLQKLVAENEPSLQELNFNQSVANQPIFDSLKSSMEEAASEPVKPVIHESNKTKDFTVTKQNAINVNIAKIDLLMDLVGELVISEAGVTRNPQLANLVLDDFEKSVRQLRKIINEIQDVVMSIRMIPLENTFLQMHRLVRDMSHKLEKKVHLEINGAETEVEKSVIEHVSDPLIHLIRNSIDHGIESIEERKQLGKPETGKIILEAKNDGGEVWINIQDDGRGLQKDKILKKALQNGLIEENDRELTEQEIFSLIFLPGFSTKDNISEFSGRGVGMDVVKQNIEKIHGNILVESASNLGTTFSIRIPLTLAIITGMTISVGDSKYTIPITSIVELLKVKEADLLTETAGEETLVIRGERYPLIRLHEFYKAKTNITKSSQGIILIVQTESKQFCLLADSILGEQQVVIKPLPKYIEYVRGIIGCTLLSDGSISLVLNVEALLN